MQRLWLVPIVTAVLVSTTAFASAAGCRYPGRIGSSYGSSGINAIAPSRAIQNPCSTMYRFGARRHRHYHHRRYMRR